MYEWFARPQMPESYKEFTVYNWSGMVKTLRQMVVTDSYCQEGINWRIKSPARPVNHTLKHRAV